MPGLAAIKGIEKFTYAALSLVRRLWQIKFCCFRQSHLIIDGGHEVVLCICSAVPSSAWKSRKRQWRSFFLGRSTPAFLSVLLHLLFLLLQRIRAVHFVVASDDTNYDLLYALAPPPTQTFCLLSCAELYDSALTRSPDCPSIYVNKLATAVQNDDCMRK